MEDHSIRDALTASWIWLPRWVDSPVPEDASPLAPEAPSAGRLVSFYRSLVLLTIPPACLIHITADTRYKLRINGVRVMLGPARSDPKLWFYDTLDVAPFLREGKNEVEVEVMRWFKATRSGMPFARSPLPGLTIVGKVGEEDIGTLASGWIAVPRQDIKLPMGTGLGMDSFMHISEHAIRPSGRIAAVEPLKYNIKTLNGELAPWHLSPRQIPLPETSTIGQDEVELFKLSSALSMSQWRNTFRDDGDPLTLSAGRHYLELSFPVHNTAFVKFTFSGPTSSAAAPGRVRMKIMYSEGYELEPWELPFRRHKADRTDATGLLLGPEDEIDLTIPPGGETTYEPFWFRTFRLIGLTITVEGEVTLRSFEATQTNYPMDVQASWSSPGIRPGESPWEGYNGQMWSVSIRTLRNCMYDGYSDCPFYEQLMYSGDTRSVGLFHYFLAGDDRLMRMSINLFAASYTVMPAGGGLTQSRFPSHVPQLIAGFPLYFIMMINDHWTFFRDPEFVRPLLPLIDGILTWYECHIDDLGLISGMEEDVWQYVDWVDTWAATDTHPDKGVPSAGRKTNRHTFFSMLYAYTLGIAAGLTSAVGRRVGESYLERKASILEAINTHCRDAELGYYTDTTVADSRAHDLPFISQHCQVFAILSGACTPRDAAPLLYRAFTKPTAAGRKISKCSYVMLFYALRAISASGHITLPGEKTGTPLYEHLYPTIMEPWRRMIDNHMTTWEEDDVRQRSDCHAWGSVPIYEFSSEIAGLRPGEAGWEVVEWRPRVRLAKEVNSTICLGKGLKATVKWYRLDGHQDADFSSPNRHKWGGWLRDFDSAYATLELSEPRRVVTPQGDSGGPAQRVTLEMRELIA